MKKYISGEPVRRWLIGSEPERVYLETDRVLIMGVLNATPDSFSDGGLYVSPDSAAARASELCRSGADIIDIGCQSTRPGFVRISPGEELNRLKSVMPAIISALPPGFPVSIDTFYPEVALYAVENGASIINDVTGLADPDMRGIITRRGCGAVLMHCDDISDNGDPAGEIRRFFERRMSECLSEGIDPEQIVLDPGIGFGKTREQELELLDRMSDCRVLDRPILAAASRKRVIKQYFCRSDGTPSVAELDRATFEAHSRAVSSGAQLVRVHAVI